MAVNCEFHIRRNRWEDTGRDGEIIIKCVVLIRLSWLEIRTMAGNYELLIRRNIRKTQT
jgi:hypothetical protein